MPAMRLLHLVAHRGNSAEFPDNTLPALRSAVALGARFIDVDVHLSSDGIPMVCHEEQLAALGAGLDLTGAQLSALDASQPTRFQRRFRGTGVPSLTTVMGLLDGRPEVTLFLTLGRAAVIRFGAAQVVAQLLRVLQPVRTRCVLVSRDLHVLHTARVQADFAIGWALPAVDTHSCLKYEALKPDFLFCDIQRLPARLPTWRAPWRWAVYQHAANLDATLALAERGADF